MSRFVRASKYRSVRHRVDHNSGMDADVFVNLLLTVILVTIVAIRLPSSHVYGQTGKKEFNIENVKVSNQAWDTNLISASAVSIILCGSLRHPPFSSP